MFRKAVLVCAFVCGAAVAGISAHGEADVPDESTSSCLEHALCIAEATCGGASWSRVGSCGMQCWTAGENGQISPGAFIQCIPEEN
jgi:hypothetical protein